MSEYTIAAAVPWQGVAFSVPGIPYPQGSKSASLRGGRPVMFEDNKHTVPWRKKVAAAARDAMNGHPAIDGPVEVRVTFFFTRPKTVTRDYPAVVPDVDKLLRAIFDGMADGCVYVNDSRVVDVTARKRYADFPCAEVTVKAVS